MNNTEKRLRNAGLGTEIDNGYIALANTSSICVGVFEDGFCDCAKTDTLKNKVIKALDTKEPAAEYRARPENKERKKKWSAEYYTRPGVKEKTRERQLKRLYGLTLLQYNQMLEKQYGRCKICGKTEERKSLHVDHDHETGRVRGLLCDDCNKALGFFHDDLALLYNAVDYLEG